MFGIILWPLILISRLLCILQLILDTFKTLKPAPEPLRRRRRLPDGTLADVVGDGKGKASVGVPSVKERARKRRLRELGVVWVVWITLIHAERILDRLFFRSWIPFYVELKFALWAWMALTKGLGSEVIYRSYIAPSIRPYEKSIDFILVHASDLAEVVVYVLHIVFRRLMGIPRFLVARLSTVDRKRGSRAFQDAPSKQTQETRRQTRGAGLGTREPYQMDQAERRYDDRLRIASASRTNTNDRRPTHLPDNNRLDQKNPGAQPSARVLATSAKPSNTQPTTVRTSKPVPEPNPFLPALAPSNSMSISTFPNLEDHTSTLDSSVHSLQAFPGHFTVSTTPLPSRVGAGSLDGAASDVIGGSGATEGKHGSRSDFANGEASLLERIDGKGSAFESNGVHAESDASRSRKRTHMESKEDTVAIGGEEDGRKKPVRKKRKTEEDRDPSAPRIPTVAGEANRKPQIRRVPVVSSRKAAASSNVQGRAGSATGPPTSATSSSRVALRPSGTQISAKCGTVDRRGSDSQSGTTGNGAKRADSAAMSLNGAAAATATAASRASSLRKTRRVEEVVERSVEEAGSDGVEGKVGMKRRRDEKRESGGDGGGKGEGDGEAERKKKRKSGGGVKTGEGRRRGRRVVGGTEGDKGVEGGDGEGVGDGLRREVGKVKAASGGRRPVQAGAGSNVSKTATSVGRKAGASRTS